MLPYITVFGFNIPMYGVMIAIGVTAAVFVAWRFPCKKDLSRQDILFSCCYAGIGAMVGAKLLYLAVTIPQMLNSPVPLVFSWGLVYQLISGGFVFYGGVLGGLIGIFIYCRQFKIDFMRVTETLIPSVPLAHSIGRIGCFCAGCCYGTPAEPPWGMVFRGDSFALHGVALLPTQLYESALNMLLFVVLFIFSRRERRSGQILGFYLVGYGVERFVLEFFRYDAIRGLFLGLSTSQWISLVLIPFGVLLLLAPKTIWRKRPE
jgi:phosphatidylglycerol:prolipoprotein diacylglycerol transferase